MIEMSCPRCGAGGRVPREKVNARLVCKKCLQVFHLTPSLKAVVGEPPVQKAAPRERDKERAPRERMELELGLGGLGEKLAKIKLPDAKILGVSAGVLLLVAIFWWIFSKENLEQRSEILATTIRKGDMDAVVALALPGTEMEAIKWLVDASKQYMDVKLNIGNLEPGVQIKAQENSDGSGQSLLLFSREGAVSSGPLTVEEAASLEPSAEAKKKSMEVVVFWAKDTWGTWRLDGKRTSENPSGAG